MNEAPRSFPHGPAVAAILAAAAAVLAYSASLPGAFHFDDKPTIVDNESVRAPALLGDYYRDASHFSSIPGNGMYRPVLLTTYLANHSMAGYRPFAWHLTNILVHALNAALVALLAARLARTFMPERPAPWLPLLAGLAFALHPAHSEVVNYVCARSDSLSTAGFLGGLLFHLAATRGSGGPIRRGFAFAGSALCFLLGLGAKEIAVMLPAVVFVLELLDPAAGSAGRRFRLAVARSAMLGVVAIGWLGVRSAVLGNELGDMARRYVAQEAGGDVYSGGGRTPWQNLMTQARVFWMYAGLFLLPIRLTVDRYVRVSTSIAEPAVLLSIAGIVVLAALAWRLRRRSPFVVFAAAAGALAMLPTSLIPLNIVMNEHRMYLPGTGVALLMGLGAARLLAFRPRAAAVGVAAAALCFAGAAVARSLEWRTPRTLWESAVAVSPRSFRAHNQLGAVWYDEAANMGSTPAAVPFLDRAIESYRRAIEIHPNWYDPHLNLGIAHRERGRITGEDAEFEESIRHFTLCTALVKEAWRARYQLATTWGVWKKYDAAITSFTTMAEEDRHPETGRRHPLYLRPIARLLQEAGRPEEAAAFFREILAGDPLDADAAFGLATALDELGRREEGLTVFEDLVARAAADPKPFLAYAEFLRQAEPPDRGRAAELYRRALSLGHPRHPAEVQRYLGR